MILTGNGIRGSSLALHGMSGTRGPFPSKRIGPDNWFDFLITPVQRTLLTPSTTNELDSVIQTAGSGSVVTDYAITITKKRGTANPVVTHSSPAVASLDVNAGLLSHLADGTDTLTFTDATRTVNIPLTFKAQSNSIPNPIVINGVAGSLRKSITEAIDLRLPGKNPTTDKFLLNPQPDVVNGPFSWNTGCWAYPIDLTCLMIYDSWSAGWEQPRGQHWAPGTAIGGPFTLHANHFWPNIGSTLSWLTRGNVRVDRTSVGGASGSFLSPNYPGYPDFFVSILNSDLPSTIKPAKVLPNGWEPYLPVTSQSELIGGTSTPQRGYKLPCLWLDQELKANVGSFRQGLKLLFHYTGSLNFDMDGYNAWQPTDPVRSQFYESVVDHDSSQPTFLIINDEPVMIGPTTSGGPGGSFLASYKTQINAIMDSLWATYRTGSNPYHLQEVNLSGFNVYS
jgi:hypothetical protein